MNRRTMQDISGNADSQSGGKVSWRTELRERKVEQGDRTWRWERNE